MSPLVFPLEAMGARAAAALLQLVGGRGLLEEQEGRVVVVSLMVETVPRVLVEMVERAILPLMAVKQPSLGMGLWVVQMEGRPVRQLLASTGAAGVAAIMAAEEETLVIVEVVGEIVETAAAAAAATATPPLRF